MESGFLSFSRVSTPRQDRSTFWKSYPIQSNPIQSIPSSHRHWINMIAHRLRYRPQQRRSDAYLDLYKSLSLSIYVYLCVNLNVLLILQSRVYTPVSKRSFPPIHLVGTSCLSHIMVPIVYQSHQHHGRYPLFGGSLPHERAQSGPPITATLDSSLTASSRRSRLGQSGRPPSTFRPTEICP